MSPAGSGDRVVDWCGTYVPRYEAVPAHRTPKPAGSLHGSASFSLAPSSLELRPARAVAVVLRRGTHVPRVKVVLTHRTPNRARPWSDLE